MKRIATEKAKETAAMTVTYGIPGTTTVFKLGDVACHTYKDNDTVVYLPTFVMKKLIEIITRSEEDYKDKIRSINDLLKIVGINKHVRHDLERQLIKTWGGHEHTAYLRRYFI